jgi:hypothetical protein
LNARTAPSPSAHPRQKPAFAVTIPAAVLRHTGNDLASSTPGLSLADLMARMGHASTRAAMIYLHAGQERDEVIADSLSEKIRKGRNRARRGRKKPKKRQA